MIPRAGDTIAYQNTVAADKCRSKVAHSWSRLGAALPSHDWLGAAKLKLPGIFFSALDFISTAVAYSEYKEYPSHPKSNRALFRMCARPPEYPGFCRY